MLRTYGAEKVILDDNIKWQLKRGNCERFIPYRGGAPG